MRSVFGILICPGIDLQKELGIRRSTSYDLRIKSRSSSTSRVEIFIHTSGQPEGTPLTLTVSNVRDTSPNANEIAPGSTILVEAPIVPSLPAEVVLNVGAASDNYELVYSLEIPAVANLNAGNPYLIDNSGAGGTFSRVAYYLELQQGANPAEFIWVAMDAFTTNRAHLGVPTVGSGAFFQENISNLDVISNKAGIVTGTGIATGNIEFWPSNYELQWCQLTAGTWSERRDLRFWRQSHARRLRIDAGSQL